MKLTTIFTLPEVFRRRPLPLQATPAGAGTLPPGWQPASLTPSQLAVLEASFAGPAGGSEDKRDDRTAGAELLHTAFGALWFSYFTTPFPAHTSHGTDARAREEHHPSAAVAGAPQPGVNNGIY